MKDNIELFDEKKNSSGKLDGPQGASTDLLVFEFDQDIRLGTLSISCTTSCWFAIQEREHDGSDPQNILGPLRHNADGLLYIAERFTYPILICGANKEIAIINLDAIPAGQSVAISTKHWERRA